MPTRSGDALSWLNLPANRESLEQFRGFVISTAEDLSVSRGVLDKIDLALEEVLLNVMDYAYEPDRHGEVKVGCGRTGNEGFRLIIQDQGRPFNPLTQHPPDLTSDIEDRGIGGLGIFLTKKMASRVQYSHDKGSNVLEMDFDARPDPAG